MKKLATTLLIAALTCGCTYTIGRPPVQYKNIPQTPIDAPYKYYVIDINSDTPDAFFETYDEASVYQDEFAENHDYVIVKIEKGFKVYSMEPNNKVNEKFSKR